MQIDEKAHLLRLIIILKLIIGLISIGEICP